MITVALLLGIYASAEFFVISPAVAKIRERKSNISTLKNRITELSAYLVDIAPYKSSLKDETDRYNSIQDQIQQSNLLTIDDKLKSFFSFIETKSGKVAVLNVSTSIKNETVNSDNKLTKPVRKSVINISFQSDYFSSAEFIAELVTLPINVQMQQMTMTANPTAGDSKPTTTLLLELHSSV